MDDVARTLSNGGVALLPTDTVYGLMASPLHPAAVAKIFALKNRPNNKNLPILVADSEQIAALGVKLNRRTKTLLATRFTPGALSMVLPLSEAPSWLAGRKEIALRIPNDVALRQILKTTGPLLATSANASGHETPPDLPSILAQLSGAPDIVVDDGLRPSQPSTLIDCQTSPFTVLRRGALNDDDLKEIMAL